MDDLEREFSKQKIESDSLKQQRGQLEAEIATLRKERQANRQSLQEMEKAKLESLEAQRARAHLEERMAALTGKKKKKNALNCF